MLQEFSRTPWNTPGMFQGHSGTLLECSWNAPRFSKDPTLGFSGDSQGWSGNTLGCSKDAPGPFEMLLGCPAGDAPRMLQGPCSPPLTTLTDIHVHGVPCACLGTEADPGPEADGAGAAALAVPSCDADSRRLHRHPRGHLDDPAGPEGHSHTWDLIGIMWGQGHPPCPTLDLVTGETEAWRALGGSRKHPRFSQEETEARSPCPPECPHNPHVTVPKVSLSPGCPHPPHLPVPDVSLSPTSLCSLGCPCPLGGCLSFSMSLFPGCPGCPCPRPPDPYSPQHYSRTLRPHGHVHQPVPVHVHPSVHADPEIPEAPPQRSRLDALGTSVVASPLARTGLCSPQPWHPAPPSAPSAVSPACTGAGGCPGRRGTRREPRGARPPAELPPRLQPARPGSGSAPRPGRSRIWNPAASARGAATPRGSGGPGRCGWALGTPTGQAPPQSHCVPPTPSNPLNPLHPSNPSASR